MGGGQASESTAFPATLYFGRATRASTQVPALPRRWVMACPGRQPPDRRRGRRVDGREADGQEGVAGGHGCGDQLLPDHGDARLPVHGRPFGVRRHRGVPNVDPHRPGPAWTCRDRQGPARSETWRLALPAWYKRGSNLGACAPRLGRAGGETEARPPRLGPGTSGGRIWVHTCISSRWR